MSASDQLTPQDRLRAAFESLFEPHRIPSEKLPRLEAAVIDLMKIDATGSGAAPNKFIANEHRLIEELTTLQNRASELADHIDQTMHQSAIVAMQNWTCRIELVKQLRETARSAAHALESQKRLLDAANKSAPAPSKGGRPSDCRAEATAIRTAYHYARLKGEEPSRSVTTPSSGDGVIFEYGQFHDLLVAVFAAVGLRQSADSYAKLAVRLRRPSEDDDKQTNRSKKAELNPLSKLDNLGEIAAPKTTLRSSRHAAGIYSSVESPPRDPAPPRRVTRSRRP